MNNLPILLAALAWAGGISYALNIFVIRSSSVAEYVNFATFWGAVYFAVGLVAGLQQEVTRATTANNVEGLVGRRPGNPGQAVLFGCLTISLLVSLLSMTVFPDNFFGNENFVSFPILIAGVCGYVSVAVLSGVLYSSANGIKVVALMIAIDGTFRFVFVYIATQIHAGAEIIQFAIVLPFLAVPAIIWNSARKSTGRNVVFDITLKKFSGNVALTVTASGAMALMVSAIPVVINWGLTNSSLEQLASWTFVITLARSPLIIVAMSLQSYLLARFKAEVLFRTRLKFIIATIALLSLALAIFLIFLGQQLFVFIAGTEIAISEMVLVSIAMSSGGISVLFVLGSFYLAQNMHTRYLLIWLLAALMSLASLLVPGSDEVKLALMLTLPPVLSILCIHYFPKLISKLKSL